jgi:hypothetical protein
MPDDYGHEREWFDRDMAFQEKLRRLGEFMGCRPDDVIPILKHEARVPLPALLKFSVWPKASTVTDLVDTAIRLMENAQASTPPNDNTP